MTINGHRIEGKTLTVGVADMLINFLMPLLEERVSGARGRVGHRQGQGQQKSLQAVVAQKQLVLCHRALDKVKRAGSRVDRENLAVRLRALDQIHSQRQQQEEGVWVDDDDDESITGVVGNPTDDHVIVEVPTRHPIVTHSNAHLQEAIQGGVLENHPRWEPRPTGSIAPEDCAAVEETSTSRQLVNSRRLAIEHDGHEDLHQHGPRPIRRQRSTYCRPTIFSSPDHGGEYSTRGSRSHSQASTTTTGTPTPPPAVHADRIRLWYIDAGCPNDDGATITSLMDQLTLQPSSPREDNHNHMTIFILANTSRTASLFHECIHDERYAPHIFAISPCPQEQATGESAAQGGLILFLGCQSHANRITVLSITPFTCTFSISIGTGGVPQQQQQPWIVHAVYLPPAMGALGDYSLFTSFFRLPGGLRPHLILGDVHCQVATEGEDVHGRVKVIRDTLQEYGLQVCHSADSTPARILPRNFVRATGDPKSTYAFAQGDVDHTVSAGEWRSETNESCFPSLIVDF